MDMRSDTSILRHVVATVSPPRAESYRVELLVSVPRKDLPEKLALVETVVNALRRRASIGATIQFISQEPEPEVIGHVAGPPAIENLGYKIWYLELVSEVQRHSRHEQEHRK